MIVEFALGVPPKLIFVLLTFQELIEIFFSCFNQTSGMGILIVANMLVSIWRESFLGLSWCNN